MGARLEHGASLLLAELNSPAQHAACSTYAPSLRAQMSFLCIWLRGGKAIGGEDDIGRPVQGVAAEGEQAVIGVSCARCNVVLPSGRTHLLRICTERTRHVSAVRRPRITMCPKRS